jgi:2-amino-4-hydroxy-6-hydroxymethyldihydropteridine diphosphokinase
MYNKEQEYFINTVAGLETVLKPFELLDLIKNIESMLGRKKQKKKNMPRIIDIDILVHGESVMETEELVIPHPHIINRKFVLIPFDEIAPDYKIPLINSSVHELLVNCKDQSFVHLHDMENKA